MVGLKLDFEDFEAGWKVGTARDLHSTPGRTIHHGAFSTSSANLNPISHWNLGRQGSCLLSLAGRREVHGGMGVGSRVACELSARNILVNISGSR